MFRFFFVSSFRYLLSLSLSPVFRLLQFLSLGHAVLIHLHFFHQHFGLRLLSLYSTLYPQSRKYSISTILISLSLSPITSLTVSFSLFASLRWLTPNLCSPLRRPVHVSIADANPLQPLLPHGLARDPAQCGPPHFSLGRARAPPQPGPLHPFPHRLVRPRLAPRRVQLRRLRPRPLRHRRLRRRSPLLRQRRRSPRHSRGAHPRPEPGLLRHQPRRRV